MTASLAGTAMVMIREMENREAESGSCQPARPEGEIMRRKIMKGMSAGVAAAGLAVLFSGPSWAASSPLPASGTFLVTSQTVNSVSTADGNTIVVVTVGGITTGTFDGSFTEIDRQVIHPGGSVTDQAKGVQSGTLGTCGTGSVPYVAGFTGNGSTSSGRVQFIDQAASTSTPVKIQSVYRFTFNDVTGEGTYTGTYHCT